MYKVNISIDDITPFPKSSTSVLDRCYELLETFPEMKFTLFVPTAYHRSIGITKTDKKYYISQYEDFCEILKKLPKENFEIGYHGHHHGIYGVTNNDEFKNLDYTDSTRVITQMLEEAKQSEIPFKPIFRPPAWKISDQAVKVLKEKGIQIIAGSDRCPPYKMEGLKYVYETCAPPISPLQFYDETVVVFHACNWDRNYLTRLYTGVLERFLQQQDVKFAFMEEI